ncbi:MAG: DUF3795 domain-containing protein [Clostridia bacterium]|nr:DUF3795 domain-containing protein [Clostridia bacterium]
MSVMSFDFEKITPCGGNCSDCEKLLTGECKGCLSTDGKCVKMWEGECRIFRCCRENKVLFCGLCSKFPCDYISKTIVEWNKDGIENLSQAAKEYKAGRIDG